MSREQQHRMQPWVREKYDFRGSLYRESCPVCGAAPFCWCRQGDGKVTRYAHAKRRGAGAPSLPRNGYHHEARA